MLEIEARARRLVEGGREWLAAMAEAHREVGAPGRKAAGKMTRTAGMRPEASGRVLRTAQDGVAGAGSSFPYLAEIQRAFGPGHDLSQVRAHVGGSAAQAAQRVGAEAYATGSDVAFRQSPDLYLAAHEAAHVVQQRAGVQLDDGVGRAGDDYERHADRVADAVVQGRSAAALLSTFTPTAGGAHAVQMNGAGGAGPGGSSSPGGGHITPAINGSAAQTIKIGNDGTVSLTVSNASEYGGGSDFAWDADYHEALETSFSGNGTSTTLTITARQVGDHTLTTKVTESSTGAIGYHDVTVTVPKVSVTGHESYYTLGPYGKDVARIEGSLLVAGDTAEMVMTLDNVDDVTAADIGGDLVAAGQASAGAGELLPNGNEVTATLVMDKEGMATLDPTFDIPGQGELAYAGDQIEVVDDPDAFLARSYPAQECAGVGGRGGFSAALNQGVLQVTVKCAIVAKPGLAFDGETATATHGNPSVNALVGAMNKALAVQRAELKSPYVTSQDAAKKNIESIKQEINALIASQFTWAAGAPELTKAGDEIKASLAEWGGQHTFTSTRTGWEKVKVSVTVEGDVSVVDADPGAHVTVEMIKLPKGPVKFLGSTGSVSEQPSTTQFDEKKVTDAEVAELGRMTPDERKAWLEKRGIADTHDQHLQLDVATDDQPMDWNAWKNKRDMLSASIAFDAGTANLASSPDLGQLASGTSGSAQKPPITVSASANDANLAKQRVAALVAYARGQLPGNKIVAGAATVHPTPQTPDTGPGVLQVGAGGKQDIFKHELGHAAFGLGDVYPDGDRRGRRVDTETEHHKLAKEMGAGGATVEMNEDVMSAGNKVSKADYAAFYKALSEISGYPWKIS